jgi:hypothetical protein
VEMNNTPKIVSGGQTGADREALDWAIEHNVPRGGCCPKGRKAEHGPIQDAAGMVVKLRVAEAVKDAILGAKR